MYVETIEIEGFKSFANRTVIPLTKKLNIIIGPNGSGKSNIIDAISFVLGESSKHLRADKGTNLIYNGSKNVSKAIVSLVVNLEDDFPKEIKDYLDEELIKDKKIIISRQIKKSGESSYYINGQRVTKSFFTNILNILRLNSPYNIIFQGDITNIIKSSSIEKRKIFEELVNIDYFENKKAKVQKELEDVMLKLSELRAILNEKEKILKELKEEKEKAELFLELEKEKNALLKAKYLLKINELNKEINQINNDLVNITTKISALSLEKKKLKDEITLLENKIEEINEKIKKEGGLDIKKLEEERIENLKEIERLNVEIEKLTERIEKINEEIKYYESKKEKITKEILNLEKEKKDVNLKIMNLEEKISSINVEFDQKDLENLEKEINRIKEEIFILKSKKLNIEEKLKSINIKIDFSNIDDEINRLREEDSKLALEYKTIKELIDKKEDELVLLKRKLNEQLQEINQDRAISRIIELKKEIEGLYGPIFLLGKTKDEYKRALEMAAGPRMRAIVVENEDIAKKVIEVLKKEKLGVLSFIPLNRIKEKSINVPKDPDIIDVAVNLIEFDPKFEKAFKYIFGDTLVIRNFESAKRIGIGKVRMVTLDGELFEATGVITGGYSRRRQGFLDYDLENKIKLKEQEIEGLKLRLEDIKRRRELINEKLIELRIKKKEIEKQKELINNINSLRKELEDLNKKISEKEEELKLKEEEYKKLKSKITQFVEIIKEKEKFLEELSSLKSRLAVIIEKIEQNKSNIKEIENRLNNLYNLDKELTRNIVEKRAKLKELEELNRKIEDQLNKISSSIKNLLMEKERMMRRVSELNKKILKIEEDLQEIEKLRYQKELKRQNLIKEREELVKLANEIKEKEKFTDNLDEKLKEVLNKLKDLKHVNFKSIEKFEEVQKEYNSLKEKYDKIEEEKNKIIKVINEIEEAKKQEFLKAFNFINEKFKQIYKELLEKGEAWLELTNKDNPFEGGVEIKVKIANKVFNLKSLSGGEQSLVALSLIFSIQEFKPGVFYVFDEVDAALDKRNSRKLAKYLKKYSEKTQFIIISHNEEVIVEADYLFGVSMNKKTGISKVIALDLANTKILNKILTE